MKTNEAPEKIYLVPFGKPIIEPLPQEGKYADTIWSSKPYANSNACNIEYTRTDAFIEKACEWIKENITENPNKNSVLVRNGCVTLGMLIENFKNYMEGE